MIGVRWSHSGNDASFQWSLFIDADTEMVRRVGDEGNAATECESDSHKTSQAKFLEGSPDTPACGMWTISRAQSTGMPEFSTAEEHFGESSSSA